MGFWEEADVGLQWRRMISIRRFEEAMIQNADAFPGHRHVYIGQEATAVGVVSAMESRDPVVTTHRNHGHNLARGADAAAMMAEIFGKETGLARGKAGTFHIADTQRNVVVASAVVTGSLCTCLGLALAAGYRKSGQVAVAFFGDGALNEGAFHETANLAGLWSVPLLMICENNNGSGSPRESGLATPSISALALAYGLPTSVVDGADVEAVHDAASRAAQVMRANPGPWFIEAKTVGFPGNQGGWPHLPDGPTDVSQALSGSAPAGWAAYDPVLRFAREAVSLGSLDAAAILATDADVVEQMEAAVAKAKAAPYPRPEDALEDLFA